MEKNMAIRPTAMVVDRYELTKQKSGSTYMEQSFTRYWDSELVERRFPFSFGDKNCTHTRNIATRDNWIMIGLFSAPTTDTHTHYIFVIWEYSFLPFS